MSSEFGSQPSGEPQAWAPPAYPQPTYPGPGHPQPYGQAPFPPPFPPQDPPGLPSRLATILITAFFGLFGLIPASMHSKRAQQLGVSGNRYFLAFGITFGAVVLAWGCVAAAVLVAVDDTSDPSESVSAADASDSRDEGSSAADQVDGQWTVENLQPVLEGFADEQVDKEGAFDTEWTFVPCGGPGQQGVAPDAVEMTAGGNWHLASAQILPDAAAAERELARQVEILQGCTEGYSFYDSGDVAGSCVPSVSALTPAVRYVDACDDGSGNYQFAIFQADNAVVTVATPQELQMDRKLPDLMSELDAD